MKDDLFSVIIPLYNEEDNIPELYHRLSAVTEAFGGEWEFIFVDDGSQDNGLSILKSYHAADPRTKIISFSRNFGHQNAISAGLMFCKGQCAMIMDGDLQDPPEVLPQFIQKWEEGYHVVYAVRKSRSEAFYKRLAYKLFYRSLRTLAGINIPLDAGDFCLMDRKAVDLIKSFPERNRFVRGLRSWVGFRQVGLQFQRDKRFAGKPKYNFFKLLKLALDGVFSFSEVPLRMVMLSGFLISTISFLFGLYVIANFMLGTHMYFITKNPGWSSLIVSTTFLGGVQLISIGILGEYIGRVFGEVKRRPHFVIDQLIGIETNIGDGHS
jgi:dolichol-phosphate mannosyltransferase